MSIFYQMGDTLKVVCRCALTSALVQKYSVAAYLYCAKTCSRVLIMRR